MIFVYILYTVYCKNSIYIKSEKNNTPCALLIDRKIITNPKDMVENFNNFYLLYSGKKAVIGNVFGSHHFGMKN